MKLLLISRFTFRELARKKLLLGVLVLSGLFLLLFAVGMYFFSQEMKRTPTVQAEAGVAMAGALLELMGLYIVAFMGALLAVFTSIGTIATEVDSGTLQAVVPKPIRRWELLGGKWLGYAAMLAVYVIGMAASVIVIVRVLVGFVPPSPVQGILLMLLQALVLLSLAILGSTALSTLATGVTVFMLYGVGWVGGLIEAVGAALNSRVMENIGILSSLLVPSDVLWKGASYYLQPKMMLLAQATPQASNPFTSTTPPSVWMVVYAIVYVVAVTVSAGVVFSRKDL